MFTLSIVNETNYKFEFESDFKKVLEAFLNILEYKGKTHVDVLITNNEGIKEISKQYRNIDKETDVLSFPFEFNNFSDQLGFIHLGEIVLSYEKIEEQAKKFNHSNRREFCFLFAHGLVHLSGRDHKKDLKEEEEFNSIVYSIMDSVKIFRE